MPTKYHPFYHDNFSSYLKLNCNKLFSPIIICHYVDNVNIKAYTDVDVVNIDRSDNLKATIISDEDYKTELFQKLSAAVTSFLNDKDYETEHFSIGRDDLAFCMGCFGCWIKKPGECVIDDMMSRINRSFVNSDTVIYLSPIIFGQFSANIKNSLDRWLPNMLPFFKTRPNGSTIHPSRYDSYPMVVIIGYGDDVSEEDSRLFYDITKKHRNNTDVLIYKNINQDITEELNLKKAAGQL